jgi:cytochrome c556
MQTTTKIERRVFKFHDGQKDRYADPMEVLRRVSFLLGDPAAVSKVIRDADPAADAEAMKAAYTATERLVVAVREAFDLAPFDPETGAGATESDCLAVWGLFSEFMAQGGPAPAPAAPPAAAE